VTPEAFSNSRAGKLPNTPPRNGGFRRCGFGTVHAVIVYEARPDMVPRGVPNRGSIPAAWKRGAAGRIVSSPETSTNRVWEVGIFSSLSALSNAYRALPPNVSLRTTQGVQ